MTSLMSTPRDMLHELDAHRESGSRNETMYPLTKKQTNHGMSAERKCLWGRFHELHLTDIYECKGSGLLTGEVSGGGFRRDVKAGTSQ